MNKIEDFINQTTYLENCYEDVIAYIQNKGVSIDTSILNFDCLDRCSDTSEWNIHFGNLNIDGELNLEDIALIVTGDLTINGNFYDNGSLLIVFGTMYCKNFISKWDVFVNKLQVEGVICNYYENCMTSIKKGKCIFELNDYKHLEGDIESDYSIIHGHSSLFAKNIHKYTDIKELEEFQKEFHTRYFADEVFDDDFYEEGFIHSYNIIELLRSGKTIFKPNAKQVLEEYKQIATEKFVKPQKDLQIQKVEECTVLTGNDMDNFNTRLMTLSHALDLSNKLDELKRDKESGKINLKEYLKSKRVIENEFKSIEK